MKIPKVHLYLRGNKYNFHFSLGGKQTRGATGTSEKSAALKIAESTRDMALRQLGTDFDPIQATAQECFNKYIEMKKRNGLAPSSEKSYNRYIDRFCEFFPKGIKLQQISKYQIEEFKHHLLSQKSKSSNNIEKKTLSSRSVREHLVFISAVAKMFDLPNPVKDVPLPKKAQMQKVEEMKFYKPDEIKKLLKTAKGKINKGQAEMEFYHWLVLFAYTGIRLGEGHVIRFKDINAKNSLMGITGDKMKEIRCIKVTSGQIVTEAVDDNGEVIEEEIKRKGDKTVMFSVLLLESYAKEFYRKNRKRVPLAWKYRTLKALEIEMNQKSMLLSKEEKNKLVQQKWESLKDDELPIYYRTMNWFYKKFEKLCEETGLKAKGVHSLRHSFATNALLRSKMSIQKLAKYLGHKDINLTYSTYGHLLTDINVDDIEY